MAEFMEAYNITMGNEGGYSNDPDDAGKETMCGISRRYFPNWEGWKIVDQVKSSNGNIDNLLKDTSFKMLVAKFYKATFWDVFLGDEIENQDVANELFDTGVNMGVKTAVTFLQKSLNVLNKNATLFPDLVEDGSIGNKTLIALKNLNRSDIHVLLIFMNVCQGQHYMEYMQKSPTQEKFARGWASRINLKKI